MICFKKHERTDCIFITYGTPQIFDKDGLEASKSVIGNPYLHTGREYDQETGLYYHRARYRSSTFGTWLSKDPIGFQGGINVYGYVRNRVLFFVDLDGLEANYDWEKIKENPCLKSTVLTLLEKGLDETADHLPRGRVRGLIKIGGGVLAGASAFESLAASVASFVYGTTTAPTVAGALVGYGMGMGFATLF